MNRLLLLLFAWCVLSIRARADNDNDPEKEPRGPKEELQSQVTQEILGLIEVAVKVAQYTDIKEKQKVVGWVQERLDAVKGLLNVDKPKGTKEPEIVYYRDCVGLYNGGFTGSGLYNIYPSYPESTTSLPVWCDQETDGGGWIVFQRRQDGSEDFERTWDEYSQGFGDVSDEFWLGNDNLVLLTGGSGQAQLRVDVTDWANGTGFALYNIFQVQGGNYRLTVDGFDESSTAGDALDYHNGMDFTTIDRDNDRASGGNCAEWMRGGFWHNYCLTADPNGPYLQPVGEYGALSPGTDQGVTWTTYTGHGYPGREYSLKGTEMKLRKIPSISP